METGRTVDPSLSGARKVRFLPSPPRPSGPIGRGARLRSERFPVRIRGGAPRRRSPIWQRHQVESLEVAGSNPSVGTIGSVAQLAEATDSKPVPCGFDSHRSHHGEVTEPGKVPGCYPEASRHARLRGFESHPLRHTFKNVPAKILPAHARFFDRVARSKSFNPPDSLPASSLQG
jgi:hypothetical protein